MRERDIMEIENDDMALLENVAVAFQEIWKRKLLVLLVTIAGMLAAFVFIGLVGNRTYYSSTATIFSASYGSSSESSEGVAFMNRYSDLIGSSRVCSKAAQTLQSYGIAEDDLKQMVSDGKITIMGSNTSSMSYGYKLIVGVTSDSAEQVVAIANAMATSFAEELNDLLGSSAIQVMDKASSYNAYNSVNLPLYIILFAGIAFVLACGSIFVWAFFSPWVRSVAQCEQNEDAILGILPYMKD